MSLSTVKVAKSLLQNCDFIAVMPQRKDSVLNSKNGTAGVTVAALGLAESSAGRIDSRIGHDGMGQSVDRIVFCLTALAHPLLKSDGGAGGSRNGFPFRKAMGKLRDLGLCRNNRTARSTMTSLGLAGGRAGRIYALVNHGSVDKCVLGIVLNLTALASSLLESEGCAGGLRNGFPLGEAVLVT